MARTITTKPQTVSSKVENPYKQPCFTVYSMEHNVYGGGFITFDHDLEAYSKYLGDGNYAYHQYRTYNDYSPEFMNQWAGQAYKEAQGHAGGSSEYGSNTCNVGYLGHQNFAPVTEYSKASGWVYGESSRQSYIPQGFRDVNTIVGDHHQDWAWYQEHENDTPRIRIGRRSACWYYSQRPRGENYIRYNNKAHATQGMQTGNSMYGGQCYNATTKKVCMVQIDGEGRRQPVILPNAPDFREYALNGGTQGIQYNYGTSLSYNAYTDVTAGPLYDFFNPSSASDYTVYDIGEPIYNNYSGHNEARYRAQTCLCDNDIVYIFTMTPHRGAVVERWQPDGSYDGVIQDWNWTTSYGYEQGDRFGSRWQCSSDGRYWWAYCPSYHYGSGIYWMAVRVSDGKWLRFHSHDSTHGRNICPIGKSNMFNTISNNKDDPGTYFRIHDLEYEFNRHNEGDNYGEWDSNYSTYLLDTPGNSTGYPWIIPAHYNTSLFMTQLEE